MRHIRIPLTNSAAEGYAVSAGSVNLVFATTAAGMIGCGAFDITALERFGVPAAKMQSMMKPTIDTIEDLLAAEVKEANNPASERGITKGMSGREALEHL